METPGKSRPSLRRLPLSAIQLLDRAILDGAGPTECIELLRSGRWQGIRLPSKPTMSRHVRERRRQLDRRLELAQANERATVEWTTIRNLQNESAPEALGRLISFLGETLTELRQCTQGSGDLKMEKVLIDGTHALRAMVREKFAVEKDQADLWRRHQDVLRLLCRVITSACGRAYVNLHGMKNVKDFRDKVDLELKDLNIPAIAADVNLILSRPVSKSIPDLNQQPLATVGSN